MPDKCDFFSRAAGSNANGVMVVDPELTSLAQSAGTTVVTLVATDAWHRTRDGLTRLWRRAQPERADTVAAELETCRADALAAAAADDRETLAELQAQWQGLMRRLLLAHPEAAAGLRALLTELDPEGAAARQLTQRATASGRARIYQAGRDQHIAER
ncbi:hypothetical protein P3T26_002443 [Streptomyces sp. MAA16]|nr:hypothetical protein [Streptomyces sp. MAA16]